MSDILSLPNRPMLPEDLSMLAANPWPGRIRALVDEFTVQGWPVLNGSFRHSSLTEGPSRLFTCNPYRLWEYASILDVVSKLPGKPSFIDVGGAGSVLPYLLASLGHEGLAVDAQSWLTDLCGHIARARKLPLQTANADLTKDDNIWANTWNIVLCVSVLEHMPASQRAGALRRLAGMVKPGGLLCLTFDYGTHAEPGRPDAGAIQDVKPLCDILTGHGLRFRGNDPRELPSTVLEIRSAPDAERIGALTQSTLGPTDNSTSWRSLAGRAFRKMGLRREGPGRFAVHNFFRMFLERPASA